MVLSFCRLPLCSPLLRVPCYDAGGLLYHSLFRKNLFYRRYLEIRQTETGAESVCLEAGFSACSPPVDTKKGGSHDSPCEFNQ